MDSNGNVHAIRKFLYSEMSKKNNLDDVIDLFMQNIGLFNNIDIIYVNEGDSNDLSKPIKFNFDFKKGKIYSNFESDELYILNQEVVMHARFQENYTFGTLFDISVDTQIVSYIDRKLRGVSNSKEIDEVVEEITKKRKNASAMNPTPYLLENSLKTGFVSKEVSRNIYNFFKILNINHSRFKVFPIVAAFLKSKIIVISFKKMYKRKVMEIFYYRYKIIYIMLMKMYLISIKKHNYEKKVIECLEFCNNDLKRMPMAELILTFEFFEKGHDIRFFSKFQKNHKNIISVIKNSTWDIFHLRILDIYMTTIRHKKAKLTLPFFFSMDKRLNEVAELIKFKMIVVDHSSKLTYPFFCNSIVMDTIRMYELEEYFTLGASKKRLQQETDLDGLIKKLESDIISLG